MCSRIKNVPSEQDKDTESGTGHTSNENEEDTNTIHGNIWILL